MDSLFYPSSNQDIRELPFQFAFLTLNHLQEPIERPHGVNSFQWIQCVKGAGELVLTDRKYHIEENTGIFLYPDIPHHYYGITDDFTVNYYGFYGYGIAPLLENTQLLSSGVFSIHDPECIIRSQQNFFQIHEEGSTSLPYRYSQNVYQILIDLLLNTSPYYSYSQMNQMSMQEVTNYIKEHVADTIEVEKLAEIAGFTKEYFCTKFKSIFGVTVVTYINNERIGNAINLLLQNPDMKIEEVGLRSGFPGYSYFISVFKKSLGMSPGVFRKTYGI